MRIRPEEISFHLSTINSLRGQWLIVIDSAVATHGGDLLLKILLEQTYDSGERFLAREFSLKIAASKLYDSNQVNSIISQIRSHIETSEEADFLDLS